jgi:DNA polymerase-3 subunit epsilon
LAANRQIILDTETTGISTAEDHRIIEIGCVEMVNRRLTGNTFHQYINPEREIDAGAIEVHGITNEFLADKPLFDEIAEDFLAFIDGAELVIHNAPFDVGFIDHELKKLDGEERRVNTMCDVLDTLKLARDKHPGQKNNLDALCRRYEVDNSNRELHGALLDAEILADVYLAMTGGQVSMLLAADEPELAASETDEEVITDTTPRQLKVIRASEEELSEHEKMLEVVNKKSGGECVWMKQEI